MSPSRPTTLRFSIQSLIREVGINPFGLKWQRFIVAVDDVGQLIGCGQVKPHWDGSYELASIAVTESWRGQGIGKAIILSLKQRTQPTLWLVCRRELRGFYGRTGFCEVLDLKQMPRYFRPIKWLSNVFDGFFRGRIQLVVMKC